MVITWCWWPIITHFQQSQPHEKHYDFTLSLGLQHTFFKLCASIVWILDAKGVLWFLARHVNVWFQTHDTLPIAFPHVAVWLSCKQCILFKFTNCSHHLEWIKWNLHKDIQKRKAFTRRQKCITTTKANISTMKMGEDASLGIRMTSELRIAPKTEHRCFSPLGDRNTQSRVDLFDDSSLRYLFSSQCLYSWFPRVHHGRDRPLDRDENQPLAWVSSSISPSRWI